MKKDELEKEVKELVIALLKYKPTKDKEIIDFNVRAFMGGFEDYLSNQSVSDEEIDKEAIRFCKEHYPEYDDITKEIEVFDHAIFWMRDTPTPKKDVRAESIKFADWLKTMPFLEIMHQQWVLESQVSSKQLYEWYLNDTNPPIKEQTKEWYKCDICGKDRYLNTTTPLEGLCVCPKKKVKGSDFDTKYTFQKQFIYCKENGICHEIEEGRTFHCFKFDNICSSKTCTHLRKELKDKEEPTPKKRGGCSNR